MTPSGKRLSEVLRIWNEAVSRGSLHDSLSILDAELLKKDDQQGVVGFFLVMKSQTYQEFGDHDSALSYALRAVAFIPEDGLGWGQVGELMMNTGNVESARACFETELFLCKKSLDDTIPYPTSVISSYIHLIEVNCRLSNRDEAFKILQEASDFSPDNPDLMLEHARQRLNL